MILGATIMNIKPTNKTKRCPFFFFESSERRRVFYGILSPLVVIWENQRIQKIQEIFRNMTGITVIFCSTHNIGVISCSMMFNYNIGHIFLIYLFPQNNTSKS
jgi:hypothetical protein